MVAQTEGALRDPRGQHATKKRAGPGDPPALLCGPRPAGAAPAPGPHVPGRHEPGTGELNYANIFKALRDAGYDRYVGFEFEPTISSEQAAAASLALLKG